ncbi:transferrin-binding protein-like solute binding protein [Phocoenobacter skyensis]|uniref:Transferrin-binding protein-like solute binding protein n=1 Tax=Phocoenobacter skyensis TaxID=97481 RepID=A0A1H7YWK5_9PAST|nr:transferrin-binding protein-like solute binding protein [Pasteurella skyensis]MDP8080138.1 transferrin-binding protein-like solute binding protein [Pasteurella skyensis]MDP8086094.1 transferrin-binding protein-like solute binding protein [Pasteurella skyensis]MDP8185822.1 transferrin-binding protein-like solute binding protein [Pasteurella skyensis]QLB22709.1 hypothetical protein A6B44_05585 [Pasteurella skyensis]SEM50652.1 Transferrin binding protein-like solute binding protein [Pasteurell
MKKLILSTAMALVLTACGSAGNSNSADKIKSGKVEGVLLAYDLQNPVKKQSEDPAGNITEYDDYVLKMTRLSKNKDINSIKINSIDVQLLPDGYDKQENYEKQATYYDENAVGGPQPKGQVLCTAVSGKKYKYVRFGVHNAYVYDSSKPNPHAKDPELGMFVQGYITTNMPTKATSDPVVYIGDAYGGARALTKGKSEIKVNFKDKTLAGTLFDWNDYKFVDKKTPIIHFNANIKENKFEGENVQGAFFGDKAAEVGGIYYNKQKNEGAVFGAKKQ